MSEVKPTLDEIQNIVRKCYNEDVERRGGKKPDLVLAFMPLEACDQLSDQKINILWIKDPKDLKSATLKTLKEFKKITVIFPMHDQAVMDKVLKKFPQNKDPHIITVFSKFSRGGPIIIGMPVSVDKVIFPWE